MSSQVCPDTGCCIYRCGCPVCGPLRRMLDKSKGRRFPAKVKPGETDRRIKQALTALPPGDRE